MKFRMRLIASVKIWVVIYPSITIFLFLFGEALTVLPLYGRTLILTIVLVPWIVFAAVPALEWIVRKLTYFRERRQ